VTEYLTAPMQFQHQLDGLGSRYNDSVLLGATCKRNHRFNDAVAYGNGTRGSHDVTILILSPELRGIWRWCRPGISRKPSLLPPFAQSIARAAELADTAGHHLVAQRRLQDTKDAIKNRDGRKGCDIAIA
jgi:hypothetical protein